MTDLELLREVDARLDHGSDEDLLALAREVDARLTAPAERPVDADDERARLTWRARRLAFVLRVLDS